MDLTGYSLYLFIETSYWLEEIFQKIEELSDEMDNGLLMIPDTIRETTLTYTELTCFVVYWKRNEKSKKLNLT